MKIKGLKNSLNEQGNELSTTDNEIINVLEPDNVEVDVFKSMKITEPYHEIEAELIVKLQKLKIKETDESSEKPSSLGLVASCLKLNCLSLVGTL